MSNKFLNQFFAKRILKDAYSEKRAAFLEALMQSSREGNLCLYEPNPPDFPDSMIGDGTDPQKPLIQSENRIYLQRNWALETLLLEEIYRLSQVKMPKMGEIDLNLLPAQKKAVQNAYENAFSIICGGPGTGKTYTAAMFVKHLLAKEPKTKIVIAAPTGKAASHFASVLGMDVEIATLHRLLRIKPGEYRLDHQRKIDADLVLVDEASMIDVFLLAKLLRSIGNQTRLVLMGDPDQLPPVETGSVFKELADLFGTRLERSMRTEDPTLHLIAEKINQGEWSPLMPVLPWKFDHELVEKLYQKIDPVFSYDEPSPEKCLKQLERFRILGALRQGPFGTDAINRQILHEMSRRVGAGQWWSVPIMITSNHPEKELYNGSSGCLIGKSRGKVDLREATAYFPTKIPYKSLPPFEVAFCLSIHKSQGSEFDHVLALFPEGSENFGKEAIYTAVTRAKKRLEVVGEEPTLKAMLVKRSFKESGLKNRWQQLLKK